VLGGGVRRKRRTPSGAGLGNYSTLHPHPHARQLLNAGGDGGGRRPQRHGESHHRVAQGW